MTQTDFYALDAADFAALSDMRTKLHNRQDRMTFDEQRDFAERMRLLLERAVAISLADLNIPKE